jgi:enamine deaminase RidA (YjgF/YER057c/UK114 family)
VNTVITPSTIAPPAARYAHGVLCSTGSTVLHTSGIVPTRPDGSTPTDIADQALVVWSNIEAVVVEAGMAMSDIVSITTYVVVGHLDELGRVMAARDAALAGHLACSTLVTVPALARPEWKMEIAVIAAR